MSQSRSVPAITVYVRVPCIDDSRGEIEKGVRVEKGNGMGVGEGAVNAVGAKTAIGLVKARKASKVNGTPPEQVCSEDQGFG